ncbi:MAG: NUDIX domain-containing protein, partial [Candidatus Hydrogenedentes bacterium]|nr:NUDIX domain-containing protein [Candidatus Hydrogenedentota bacterium]
MSPAYGIFDWNFCPICGLETIQADDGQGIRPHCPPCDRFYYSNPTPAACCFLTNENKELLLVQRSIEPRKGLWTLPGGFVEVDETTEEAALRELEEETGLTGAGTRLLGVATRSSAKHGGIIVIGYTVDRWEGKMTAMTDAMDLGFYAPDSRPPIAFEVHQELIAL